MRQPFEMPSGCPPVVFDINIIPDDFGLCSIPDLTQPTAYPPTVQIPDFVIPPPFCPCIPTMLKSSGSTVRLCDTQYSGTGGTVPKFDIEIRNTLNASGFTNCCEPNMIISYALDIPCLPITINAVSGQTQVFPFISGLSAPELIINIVKLPDCEGMEFEYDLKLPPYDLEMTCYPVSITPKAGQATRFTISNIWAKPGLNIEVTQLPSCAGIEFNYSLDIPCFPATVHAGDLQTNRFDIASDWTQPGLDLAITKLPACSGIQFSYNLDIPCFPQTVAAAAGQASRFTPAATWTQPGLRLGVEKLEDCAGLQFSYDLDIPCFPQTVQITGTVSPAALSGNFTMTGLRLPDCGGIELQYNYTPPRSLANGSSINNCLIWDTGTSRWVPGPCPEELPTGSSVNNCLVWDDGSSAWIAGPCPEEVPAGSAINDILYWNGSAWVATSTNVRKLVAGTNITISPIGGTGEVTINSTSSAVPAGTNANDMLYWNGSAWTVLTRPSSSGNFFLMCISGTLTWVEGDDFTCP